MTPELPPNAVHPKTRDEWRAWLEKNHTQTEGIWLVTYKKATGKPRVDYEEAVEEALCFGWIDSKANTLDDERSVLWMSPRKPRTGWARTNKNRVERLIASGRMTAAGLVLTWIGTAKKPETRAKRVEETARLAAENIRANQWRADQSRP